MTLPHYRRSGACWYVSDGLIWDDLPTAYRPASGRPLECSSKLFIFNPQPQKAQVEARFYHIDRPPTRMTFSVAPQQIETIELATLQEVPHKQSFWICVESDVPVLPQACHADYTFWETTPDALISVAPYPGPLEDETTWVFPDCFQGGSRSWYERETLTILNPNKENVKARLRYLLRGRELGGEETIEIPGERVAALSVWERTPRLLGTDNGPPIQVLGDYAVRIDATAPVIPQTTRRARWKGFPSIVGARSLMGFPLRHADYKLWYYPGGAIIDRGVLPRGENCDVTWNLLFTHNLHESEKTTLYVMFHYADGGARRSQPIEIPPMKSNLQWLHLKPWLGEYTRLNEPWAMTVTADRAVAPEVTCAEFEMWSQVCPGAMSAAHFYPGPLIDEQTWRLGVGYAGGADNLSPEWAQAYHLLNPGEQPVNVELSFLGFGDSLAHSVKIPPGAVIRVDASEIAGLPMDKPFAVQADGDAPFCAQVFVRAFTRGLPHTRSMYSMMGAPMRL